MTEEIKLSAEAIEEAANFLKSQIHSNPKIAMMYNSNLDTLSEILAVRKKFVIPYSKIPHFPKIRSKGSYQLVSGFLGKTPIVILQGKLHLYEGYNLQQCTMIVYVLKQLGVEYLLLGNTSGAVNSDYNLGDIVLIKKHVYLMGFDDLYLMDDPFNEKNGPRFVNRKPAYDKKLMSKSKEILTKDLGFHDGVHTGTYAFVSGPNYETVAEAKFLKACKVDAVGMCIVPEVLAAKRCRMTVSAFSLITNVCTQHYNNYVEVNHDDVIQISIERSNVLKIFVEKLIDHLNTEQGDNSCGDKEKEVMFI